MKVLLDECLPVDFRHELKGHEVHTADWAGFKSLSNGKLLDHAEGAGYDVLITVDQGVPHQQNIVRRRISVLGIRPATIQMEDLRPMVAPILAALNAIHPGQIALVSM